VRAAIVSSEGIQRASEDKREQVSQTAALIVSDQGVHLVTGGQAENPESESIPYGNLVDVSVRAGERIKLATIEGTEWLFTLRDGNIETRSAIRHLRWVGELRSRLVRCRNDLETAAETIKRNAKNLEWKKAAQTYEDIRGRLDQIICAVQWTEPIDDAVIAPELTQMERTIESARARLYIRRAASQLELGQQLLCNGDYEQARTALHQAGSFHKEATRSSEAVKRGDAFQFGTQRELEADLKQLSWELETVAAEPIKQASEATLRARSAENRTSAIEHWESALQQYNQILTLGWTAEDYPFVADRTQTRAEIKAVAAELVELYRSEGKAVWNSGVTKREEGDRKAAIEACQAAISHLERATELAPARCEKINSRIEEMRGIVTEIRQNASMEPHDHAKATALATPDRSEQQKQKSTTPRVFGGETNGEAAGKSLPDADTVAAIDTHHNVAVEFEPPSHRPETVHSGDEPDTDVFDSHRSQEDGEGNRPTQILSDAVETE
jgi:tetratricopeptide (TPR) repeat protein